MATNWSSSIQGKYVYVTEASFLAVGTTEINLGLIPCSAGPDSTTTVVLSTVVPSDGAELVAMTFTVLSAGTVTTSGTNQWSISDGTNALATLAATNVTQTAGTVISLTMGTATNGKNIATTAGSRLILTNTEVGTVSDGIHGQFRLVWAL